MKSHAKDIYSDSNEMGVKMKFFRFLTIFLSLAVSACATLAPEISTNKTPIEIVKERMANAHNSIEANRTPIEIIKAGIFNARNLIESISREAQESALTSARSLSFAVPSSEIESFQPTLYSAKTNEIANNKTMKIKWITTNGIKELIKACSAAGTSAGVLGCATWGRETCIIITPPNTALAIIGHEFRHCFTGSFH